MRRKQKGKAWCELCEKEEKGGEGICVNYEERTRGERRKERREEEREKREEGVLLIFQSGY